LLKMSMPVLVDGVGDPSRGRPDKVSLRPSRQATISRHRESAV
jgi:hypothetical protein